MPPRTKKTETPDEITTTELIDLERGSSEAVPKVKYSPYFDEYTVTSQF